MLLNQKPKHVVDYLAAKYRGVLDALNISYIALKLVGALSPTNWIFPIFHPNENMHGILFLVYLFNASYSTVRISGFLAIL